MPTLIDTLIIELGLDPTQFVQGAKDAATALLKTHDETVKHSKDMEHEVGEKLTAAFKRARDEIVAFGAALLGARTLSELTSSFMATGNALGTLAQSLGMAPQQVSAVELALERQGVSADRTGAALSRLNDMNIQAQTTGNLGPLWLQKMGGLLPGDNAVQDMERVVTALKASGMDFVQQREALTEIIHDDALSTTLLTLGVGGVRKEMADASKDAWTAPQIKAANDLLYAWEAAKGAALAYWRDISVLVDPALTKLLGELREFIEAQRGAIQGWIGDKIKELNDWLAKNPAIINDIWNGLKKFGDQVNTVVGYLGGWKDVGAALLAIWLGTGPALAVAAILSIASALTKLALAPLAGLAGSGGAGAAWSLGGIIAGVLGAITAGSLIFGDISGNKAVSDRLKKDHPDWTDEEMLAWADQEAAKAKSGSSGFVGLMERMFPGLAQFHRVDSLGGGHTPAEVSVLSGGTVVGTPNPMPAMIMNLPAPTGAAAAQQAQQGAAASTPPAAPAPGFVSTAIKGATDYIGGGVRSLFGGAPAAAAPSSPPAAPAQSYPSWPTPPAPLTPQGLAARENDRLKNAPAIRDIGIQAHANDLLNRIQSQSHGAAASLPRFAAEVQRRDATGVGPTVTVGAIHVHGARQEADATDHVRRQIRRDMLALRIDTGLA